MVGRYLIKQPDGRLAIYSDGVDAWLQQDLTADEYVAYRIAQAAKEAERDARLRATEVLAADYGIEMSFAEANATAKAHGHEVLPGPLDEKLYAEMMMERKGGY
jgi:hypothetical protein